MLLLDYIRSLVKIYFFIISLFLIPTQTVQDTAGWYAPYYFKVLAPSPANKYTIQIPAGSLSSLLSGTYSILSYFSICDFYFIYAFFII